MRYVALTIAFGAGLLMLAACNPATTAPDGKYVDPGFSAYCEKNPGVGTCPGVDPDASGQRR
jgi:hypothetical protein